MKSTAQIWLRPSSTAESFIVAVRRKQELSSSSKLSNAFQNTNVTIVTETESVTRIERTVDH